MSQPRPTSTNLDSRDGIPHPTANPPRRLIFILEDDALIATCWQRALQDYGTQIFSDAITASAALNDGLPDLILLDVLLNGPDGFTLLNDLISYPDTAAIPVIVLTSLDLSDRDLSHYGVVKILNKDTVTPKQLRDTVDGILRTNPQGERNA